MNDVVIGFCIVSEYSVRDCSQLIGNLYSHSHTHPCLYIVPVLRREVVRRAMSWNGLCLTSECSTRYCSQL